MEEEIRIAEMKNPVRQEIDVEACYTHYGPMVLRRCRKMLKDEQTAYDAMHDVFLRVLKSRERLTGEHPSALLYRIATNVCLNRIRNDRAHETREYLDVLHHISFFENQDHELAARNLLGYVLKKEKEFTRKIAVMYFIDGMTIKEIAAIWKLSISGIHKRLEKLRRRIREKGEIS